MPAWRTLPRMTCSTCEASTPARSRAPRIAMEPRAGAGSEDSFPRNDPTGVRAAERMTVFFMALPILTPALLPSPDANPGRGLRGKEDRPGDLGRDRHARDAAQDSRPDGRFAGRRGDPAVLRRRGHRAHPAGDPALARGPRERVRGADPVLRGEAFRADGDPNPVSR